MEAMLQLLQITRENPVVHIRRPDRIKLIYDNLFEKATRIDLPAKMECLSLLYDLFSLLAQERTAASQNPHITKVLEYIHTIMKYYARAGEHARAFSLELQLFSKNVFYLSYLHFTCVM